MDANYGSHNEDAIPKYVLVSLRMDLVSIDLIPLFKQPQKI